MREIKFRGKRIADGKWLYGDFNYGPLSGESFINGSEVEPETVGQYTGLKDKNGKEIYEGNIVEAWSQGMKATGEVRQRIDGLWIMYPAFQDGRFWGLCPDNDGKTTVKVIGDIRESNEYWRKSNGSGREGT